MAMSVSVQKSSRRTNIDHNNREMSEKEKQKNSHIDHSRSHENKYLVKENIKAVYEREFGEALEQYNAKQKRNDRKIKDYYQHITRSKKTHTQQEMIIQIGDKDDFKNENQRQMAVEMLEEYFKSFEERNPQLVIYNAVIHVDEASPHMHLNFVPVATDYKRGLEKQVAFDKAIKQQDKTLNKERPFADWRDKEVAVLTELLKERNIERKLVGANNYRDVNEYKKEKDLLKEFERQIDFKKSEWLSLNKEVEKFQSEATEWAMSAENHAENSKVLEKKNNALKREIEANKEYIDEIKDTVSKIPEWVTDVEIEYETEKVKDGLFKTSLERTGRVVVDERAFNSIKVLAEGTSVLKSEIRKTERELERLEDVIQEKNNKISSLNEQVSNLEATVRDKDNEIDLLNKTISVWKETAVTFVKNMTTTIKKAFVKTLGRNIYNFGFASKLPENLFLEFANKNEVAAVKKEFGLAWKNEEDKEKYIELMCKIEKNPEIAIEHTHTFHSCGNREKSMDPLAVENMISVRLEAIEQFKSENKDKWQKSSWVRCCEHYWNVAQSKLHDGIDITKFIEKEPGNLKSMIKAEKQHQREKEAHVIIPMPKKTGRSKEIDRGWGLER